MPPPVIRTEKTTLLWALSGASSSFVQPTKRFGIVEEFTPPDPAVEFDARFAVGSDTRSRSAVLPQREVLRGTVPNIVIQATEDSLGALALPLGRQSAVLGATFLLEGITSTDNRSPFFTLGVVNKDTDGNTALTRIYNGCKANRATYSAREGEELRLTLDEILALDMHVPQTAWQHTSVYNPFVSIGADPGPYNAGRFQFNMAAVTVFGVTLPRARAFSLSVDNQVTPRYYFNKTLSRALRPSDLIDGKRTYTLQIDVDISDANTDLEFLKALVNHGMRRTDERVAGGNITIDFQQDAQVGLEGETGRVVLVCDPNPTVTIPGAVLRSGGLVQPPSPAGLPTASLVFDVSQFAIVVNPDV